MIFLKELFLSTVGFGQTGQNLRIISEKHYGHFCFKRLRIYRKNGRNSPIFGHFREDSVYIRTKRHHYNCIDETF